MQAQNEVKIDTKASDLMRKSKHALYKYIYFDSMCIGN